MVPVLGNVTTLLAVQFGADKTWAETATITTAEQTATLKGLRTTDIIVAVTKPTAQAGLGIVGWRVSANDTIAITFANPTAAGITATAAETYTAIIAKLENTLTNSVS